MKFCRVIFTDGSHYIGEWKELKKHGRGKHTYPNGEVEEGIWNEGEFYGNTRAK